MWVVLFDVIFSFLSRILQIGISFQPAEVQKNVYASVIEDMILKVRIDFTVRTFL